MSQQPPGITYMSNAIGSSRDSNRLHRICHLRAVPLGHATVVYDQRYAFHLFFILLKKFPAPDMESGRVGSARTLPEPDEVSPNPTRNREAS